MLDTISVDTTLVAASAAGIVAIAIIAFSWFQLRRLTKRVKRLEYDRDDASARAAAITRPRPQAPPDLKLSLRPCTDVAAPADFVIHGLNASGFVPVEMNGAGPGHLVVLVLLITNVGRDPLLLRRPYLVFGLGGGATKLEPPATIATLGRLSFYDAASRDRLPLGSVRDGLLERIVREYSLNRPALELKPFQPVVSYAAFMPGRLENLPVFREGAMDFGVGFYSSAGWHQYGGFRAHPFRNLDVTYYR
ncbi:MAG: hypothetical protein PVH29_04875 [Candidatus Zixiibacteriota bacterium]|jgi:hypothetical protein